MQNIAIFGSTGSIGISTLEVLRINKDKFRVYALTANSQLETLYEQCVEFKPDYAVLLNPQLAQILKDKLKLLAISTLVLSTKADLIEIAKDPQIDIVMSAIVGSAGLLPTYYAAKTGKRILLANKESMVAAGNIINDTVNSYGAKLIPVDSEHSAIFQCLPFNYQNLTNAGVNKLILTASGGPFLNYTKEQLQTVSAEQAIKHPNWTMGKKISIDSATLMNKGLELIEAYWLFKASPEQLQVVIHPQSIIHSMVEYQDSSILAQLGTPDMKTAIAYAISAPERINSGSKKLNFTQLKNLTFDTPNLVTFPCLKLAFDVLGKKDNSAIILNASNEIAVAAYLNNQIKFYDIPKLIEIMLEKYQAKALNSIEDIVAFDSKIKAESQLALVNFN